MPICTSSVLLLNYFCVVKEVCDHLDSLTNHLAHAIIVTWDTTNLSLSHEVSLLGNSFPLGTQLGNSNTQYGVCVKY